MKIRNKICLVIIFTISVSIILINVIGSNILLSSFESLEEKKLEANIERFSNALNNEINQLNRSVGDWSFWDDTYKFIGGEFNEFVDTNIDDPTMTNLRTDIMLYVNKSGYIFYERGFDYYNQKEFNISPTLNGYISKDSILVNFSNINCVTKGLVNLPEGPMLIAARPITKSDRSGPIRGSIIWGRFLNDDELKLLSDITNLSISVNYLNNQYNSTDFKEASQYLSINNDIFIQTLDDDFIEGYTKFEDIFGKPFLLIKITMDRDTYKQGILTLQYFQLILVVLGIILIIVLFIFLDKALLYRLNNLNKQVQEIGNEKKFSKKIQISGDDELNETVKVFNDTFHMIENINKTLEQKVLERTNKIDNLLKQKDEFINQLGHDLKNPLNPLVNLLPILKESDQDSKNKEIYEVLIRNVNYMKKLVLKTIELKRLDSSNTKFNFEDVNLLTEINNILKDNELMFLEKNIDIKNNIPENIMIHADKLRFNELIINLLTNAAKYTHYQGKILVDAKQDNNSVTVSIKDSGIGMNNEQLDRVFDEFYKADSSRHDFDSSGLGLSICKRIVEKHKGLIWAESEGLGKGSTFYFTIPKNQIKNFDTSLEDIYSKIDRIEKRYKNNLKSENNKEKY